MEYIAEYSEEYLEHHGILGQKWGVRRYQNEDGSVTPAGAKRYYENGGKTKKENRLENKRQKAQNTKESVADYIKKMNAAERASDAANKQWDAAHEKYKQLGKNKVSRIINAMKGKSAEAKEYTKLYNKASDMSDAADLKLIEAKQAYKKTGSSKISRVSNNIKYDPNRLQYKADKEKAKAEWKKAAEKYGKLDDEVSNAKYEKAADKYIQDMKEARKKRWS